MYYRILYSLRVYHHHSFCLELETHHHRAILHTGVYTHLLQYCTAVHTAPNDSDDAKQSPKWQNHQHPLY
jgi:hypothetical protein